MRLLVVEDEEDLAEGLRGGLTRTGYAADTAQAYEHLTINEYDLMLLDINPPDGDGFTLCGQLRDGEVDAPGDGDLRALMLIARSGLDDLSQEAP